MEQVIKQAAQSAGPAAQVIEVQEAVQEAIKPEGGVPWGGVGIGVVVVAVAIAVYKKCGCKK